MSCFIASVSLALTLHSPGPRWTTQDEGAPRKSVSQEISACVLGPSGDPWPDIEVASATGARTCTDARGEFHLILSWPEGVQDVELVARGPLGSNLLARTAVPRPQAIRPASQRLPDLQMVSDGGCSPGWLPRFGGYPGSDSGIRAMASIDLGTGPELFAAGSFQVIGSTQARRIARERDGQWEEVRELAEALAGGGEVPSTWLHVRSKLTRSLVLGVSEYTTAISLLLWDGTTTSRIEGPLVGDVLTLHEHDEPGGPVLFAGGRFLDPNATRPVGLLAWNGERWSRPGPLEGYVFSMASFDDGSGPSLFVGGNFDRAGGNELGLARWDGSKWYSVGNDLSGTVQRIVVYDAGGGPQLYACGRLGRPGTQGMPTLVRWNGRTWSFVDGLDVPVMDMVVHDGPQGSVLIVNSVETLPGGGVVRALAWNGSRWWPLGSDLEGTGYALTSARTRTGNVLYMAGISAIGTRQCAGLARFDGEDWAPIESGLMHTPDALLMADSGTGPKLHVAADNLGVLRHDGERWETFGGEWPNCGPRALVVHDDGSGAALYAGGFGSTQVVRLDGTRWTPLAAQPGGSIFALAEFDEGAGKRLFAAGFLEGPGGRTEGILRWNGRDWSILGEGLYATPHSQDPYVEALAVHDDGSGPALYVAGQFSSAGGRYAPNIARWNGAQWTLMGNPIAGAQGFNARVHALAVFDDGNGPALYAGGAFTSSSTHSMRYLARWDGQRWNAVGGGMDREVQSLATHDDGRGPALFVGGRFLNAGGVAARGIARWDGASWSALELGLDGGLDGVARLLSANLGAGPALVAAGGYLVAPSGDSQLALWGCPDSSPPRLECQTLFVVDRSADGPGEAVELSVEVEDEDPHPTLEFSPPSGSFFPRGSTQVTCRATDASGNQSSCTFEVRVQPRHGRR